MSAQPKADDLSFEQALVELEKIVSSLESGQAPLADSITAYERGMVLKKQCEQKLNEAQEKIEKITIDANGAPTATSFEEK